MEVSLKNTTREDLEKIIPLGENEKILIIKTLNNLPLVMKYVKNRTSVRSVLNCLRQKVEYKIKAEENEIKDKIDKLELKHGDNQIKNLDKSLESYGIHKDVEELCVTFKKMNINYQYDSKNCYDTISKIEKSFEKRLKYGSFQVFIKSIAGKTHTFDLPKDVTIEEIKYMYMAREGAPINEMRIIFSGLEMKIGNKFSDYLSDKIGKNEEFTIHCLFRLRGGMYHEFSGRNGEYLPLEDVLDRIYTIDADLY